MHLQSRHPLAALTLSFALTLAACAAGDAVAGRGGGGGDDLITIGAGLSASYPAYANTPKALYGIDPDAPGLGVTKIGAFDCIGGDGEDPAMTDLAVSQSGDLWAISERHLHRLIISGSKVRCASSIPLASADAPTSALFYGLTFAPAGVIDDGHETLIVGNTAGQLFTIEPETFALTPRGTLGNVPPHDGRGHTYPLDPAITGDTVGKPWELSGDIVFLANEGNPIGFATVRDCKDPPSSTSCDGTDTLVEIDMPKLKTATKGSVVRSLRGAVVRKPGCADVGGSTGYGGMYGIAAWNDKVYGFSKSGAIVAIDNADGSACLAAQRTSLWYGAGVTTVAPVIEPPR